MMVDGRHPEHPFARPLEPEHLNHDRQILNDIHAARQNQNPGQSVAIATEATAPPNASEPVSPMNTLAGWKLYNRYPSTPPAITGGEQPGVIPCGLQGKHQPEQGESHQGDTAGQPVHAVGEIRAIGEGQQDEHAKQGREPGRCHPGASMPRTE